jgi:hypothetical protein
MAYWIVVAVGGFDNVAPASLVLFELPTFLFLVMFSCVVFLWDDDFFLIIFACLCSGLRADFQVALLSNETKRSWYILAFQLIKIVCVLILLIGTLCEDEIEYQRSNVLVYYTIPSGGVTLPCVDALPSVGGPRANVSLAYAVVIAAFGTITAVSGLAIGTNLIVSYMFS